LLHNPHETATQSQLLAAAARQARLHRFSSAAAIPVGERLPGSETLKAMPPIPNAVIAEACEIVSPRMVMNRIEAIQLAVLAEYPSVTMYDLKSPRRNATMVRARQIAMYLSKTITARSLPEIGRRFGGRDHTTVLHAVRKIEAMVAKDAVFAAELERIKQVIPDVGI
jgi:chromosomal replication initiator protein